ncbi:sulfotransferase family protein [Nocardioides aequoreus]|uniref:sulfotransferase family protein n=1 Tax=Nocardioides aequoreus TaxID=397278 RepID=UPI000A077F7A|nr:sulfotransferase [Nocardioides aequoreus]
MTRQHPVRRLAALVRRHAPAPVLGAIRRAVHAWGMLTARWRMQPAVLVVGAQRAGTTTLFRVLNAHPQVARPTAAKGIGYFDVNHHRGARWYRAHFPVTALARRRHGPGVITFDSSGYYLFHPLAPGRIAHELPDVRVIVMVRDPVERAYSAYKHEHARGFETEDFATALELEDERLAGEVDRIVAEPTYESFHHRHHAYRGRSRYSEQIERYREALGADRVHVADADEFFVDPVGEFARIERFLGLTPWQPESVERWNARPGSPLDPDVRRRLDEEFAPYDERLAQQMGRTPRWRRTSPRGNA